MTQRRLVMAIDVGSTTARAGVFGADGRLLGRATHPFAINRPQPDWAEHDSDEIWRAVCAASRGALAEAKADPAAVAGLAFDATCSLVMLGADDRPASVSPSGEDRWNVVMWADHRATVEAEEFTASGHRVLDHVGGVMSPEMELPKLLWLKRHQPKLWARYGRALDLADFLLWRATGRAAISTCTVTCKWTYLAHETPGWQQDLLDRFDLGDLRRRLKIPDTALPIGATAGPLGAEAARELGLTTSCIGGVGLIDAHAGGVGVLGGRNAAELNTRLAMIAGTSTCHMAVSATPRPIPGVWGPYFGAMIPGLWLNEGGQSASGALLDHVLDWHAEGRALGKDRHARVGGRAAELVAAEGPAMLGTLQVLPDFHGNRSPLADPHARGGVLGLSIDSGFDSLARLYYAAALGVALGTRHIVEAMNARGYAIDRLHLTGGHVASELLVRLYADATGCHVVLPEEEDGVLLGTAAVAATAAGLHPSLEAAGRAMVREGRVVAPDRRHADFFDRRYRAMRRLQEIDREMRGILGDGA
ncbi:MAG: FGGY-family carbohydrate kinase [Alphaproteobacteria bacterium]|nr:FGGY-family carbohydrate kinase [Alphaproteobacteria bacterium]